MYKKMTVVMIFAFLLACAPALAASTEDQVQMSSSTGVSLDAQFPAGQTFTAVRSGKLDRVSLPMALFGSRSVGDLLLSVQSVDAEGMPSGTVLGTVSLPVENFTVGAGAAWRDLTLARPVTVESGTQYALVVSGENRPTDGSLYNWPVAFGNPYAGGDSVWRPGTSTQWETRTDQGVAMDYAFKTFVEDVGAPTVGSTDPAARETGVARNAVVRATFSEAMNPDTLTKRSVTLREATTGRRVPAVVSCNDPCTQVTLEPFGDEAGRLKGNTKYRAAISTGATDVAGNALDTKPTRAGLQGKTWTFTTGQSTTGPR
jgi:hypothetical protein